MKLARREEITSRIIKELELLLSADKALTNFIYLDEKMQISIDEAKAIKGVVSHRISQIQRALKEEA